MKVVMAEFPEEYRTMGPQINNLRSIASKDNNESVTNSGTVLYKLQNDCHEEIIKKKEISLFTNSYPNKSCMNNDDYDT